MIFSDVDIQNALRDKLLIVTPTPSDDQYSPSALDLARLRQPQALDDLLNESR